MAEVERRAAEQGLPAIRWPDPWPGNMLTAMRAAAFAQQTGQRGGLLARRLPPGVRRRPRPQRARQRAAGRGRVRAASTRVLKGIEMQSVKDALHNRDRRRAGARRNRGAHDQGRRAGSSGATIASKRPPRLSANVSADGARRLPQRATRPRTAQPDGAPAQALAAGRGDLPRGARQDDADPALRGARRRDVREGQDRRLPAPVHRRGGDGRRLDPGDARAATTCSPPTASTARRWRAARRPNAVMAELFGTRRRLLRAAAAARCTCSTSSAASWAATGSSAATCRSPPASRSPRDYTGTDDVRRLHVRRRRHQPGHLRRDDEPRRALEPAGRVHGDQQPVRHGHRARAPLGGDRPVAKAEGFGVPGDALRRHGRARRARRASPRRCAGRARTAQPQLRRGRHLPLPRPLDGRPRGVPHQGGGRGVARARPDRGLPRAPRRRRACSRTEDAERARQRGDRGRRRGRASSPTTVAVPRRSTRSTTTSTCSATRCGAGTRSTSARPTRTAARTSARSASARRARAGRGRRRVRRSGRRADAATAPARGGLRGDGEPRRGGPSRWPTMRYREALNQALREEMQADESVFLMGEDIGVFQGAFKVTAGLLEEFGEKRVRDTPISENTIVGMGVGAAMAGLRPVVEMMTINFSLLAIDQIINYAALDPLHVRRPGEGADGRSACRRAPATSSGPRTRTTLEAMFLHVPGPAGGRAVHAGRREGPAQGGDPRRQPGDLHRARDALRAARRGARERRADALRRGGDPARGRRRDDRRHLAHGDDRRAGGRDSSPPSTRSRPR